EVRSGVVVVVLQRLAQMLLCELVAAPKEARHFVVPASQRAIRGSLLKRGVDTQHGEQRILDWLAVFDALPDTKRFGERAHAGGHPELAPGPPGLQSVRLLPAVDALLEPLPLLARRRVAAEPVIGARELPRSLESVGATPG